MALLLQWYASMMYWFPLREQLVNCSMSSVQSLLMGLICTCSSFEAERVVGCIMVVLVLVERSPLHVWVRWPLIVSVLAGQYLDTLAYVRPGQVE